MNTYELTLVLSKDITPAKSKSFSEKIEKTIKALHGEVKEIQDWGKVELEYPIKQQHTGAFTHFVLVLNGESAKAVKDKLRLEDDIIRYLLVRKD